MTASRNRLRQGGYWLIRLVLGAAFIYAAILKISAPQEFADSIAAYQILPSPFINPLALGLPLFELSCGLLVLTGRFFRVGLLGIFIMLALFMTASAVALFRGLSIDCNCFGPHAWIDSNPWMVLVRDAILLGISVFLYGSDFRDRTGELGGINAKPILPG